MAETIFITGSTRGIGKAVAEQAANEGFTVILHGREKTQKSEAFANSLGVEIYYFDISNEDMVNRECQKILKRYPTLKSIINCAGTVTPQSYTNFTFDNWSNHFMINVMGIINVVNAMSDNLDPHGSIVNIASVRGVHGMASDRVPAYSASKAALISVTETMAKHFSPGIRVNAVSPSFTLTDMSKSWDKSTVEKTKNNLLKRAAEPSEISNIAIFLASDASSHITGQNIIADGGYSVRD
jgi:NAD(P)-dependent dehydrogenase (short-subunit alcohol dehydrogenase family)